MHDKYRMPLKTSGEGKINNCTVTEFCSFQAKTDPVIGLIRCKKVAENIKYCK